MQTKNCKKKRAPSKFQKIWKNIPELKDWLTSRYSEKKGLDTAYCAACHSFLTNGKRDLMRHASKKKHVDSMNVVANHVKEGRGISQFLGSKKEKNVVEGEILLTILLAKKNTPIRFTDFLIPTLKRAFCDSDIVSKITLGRTKCSNVIRQGRYNLFYTFSYFI